MRARPVPCRVLALVTAAASVVHGGPAFGGDNAPQSNRAWPTPPGEGGVAGPATYATGFEPGEGFAIGYIGGNGTPAWGAFAGSSFEPRVASANPASGAQHLRIAKDPLAATNVFVAGFSPNAGPVTPGPATFSVDVAISATGGAAYEIVLQAPSQGMLAARVRFAATGDLLVFDNPGTFLQFVDTGFNWTPGDYFTFSICMDPDADTLEYYVDGELVYASLVGLIGASAMEQVILASNNSQSGDHGDFDDVSIAEGLDCDDGGVGPVNDECDDALPIGDGDTAFDTTNATTDGPPHLACLSFGDNQVNQDVWYDYTATCTGDLTISTCNQAGFDTRLAAYEESSCPVTDERLLGCNDDAPGCADFSSLLTVPVTAGASYKIRVGGFGAETGSGTLTLSCDLPGGPANNSCVNAVEIGQGLTAFDTIGASTDGPAVGCSAFVFGDDQVHNDIWYTFTADCTGDLLVSTCGMADFDTRLAVYVGFDCPVSDAALLACNDDDEDCPDFSSRLFVTVSEGQQYTIRVGGFDAFTEGTGTLELAIAPTLTVATVTQTEGYAPGETVPVELWMSNLCNNEVAGFQAFLEFDEGSLQFVDGEYTDEPFGQHILAPIQATGPFIDLAAGINQFAGQMPTTDDALLATLHFTALAPLCKADVAFRPNQPPTRLTDPFGQEVGPLLTFDGSSCPPDVNADGVVNVDDLIAVILAWGTFDCNADVNGDGSVDVDDLVAVIIGWGPCPEGSGVP